MQIELTEKSDSELYQLRDEVAAEIARRTRLTLHPGLETVRIKPEITYGSGRREGWVKRLVGVDQSKENGFAFDGVWLKAGREVDLYPGTILLYCDPVGSVKYGGKLGRLEVLDADGTLLRFAVFSWEEALLSLRDAALELIRMEPQDRIAAARKTARAHAESDG